MLKRLGLAQAVDVGGCGGPQPPISNTLSFETDLI